MNIFKRELTIFTRSKLSKTLFFISSFLFSAWIVFGLNSFKTDNLDIVSIYNIVPIILSVIIPLLSYNFWQREIANGLDGILINSTLSIEKIILFKFLSYIVIFTTVLLFNLPIVFILSKIGFIDFGQLFSINLGLLLFTIFAVSLAFLISLFVKGRILNTILGIVVLFFISFGNERLLTYFSGLIEFKNIISILLLSTLFLGVVISILKRKVYYKRFLIILPLFVGSLFIPGSLDLTSLQSHSLTDYSKEIISTSKEDFEFIYYYSMDLNITSSLPKAIIHLLDQYDREVNVTVKYVTDRDDSFFEALRIYKPTPIIGDSIFNFIVIKYKGDYKTIPLVSYVETLEFEIGRVIHYFLDDGLKSIGIYIGNDDFTEDNFTGLYSTLSDHFNVKILFPGDTIPNDFDALLVVGHYGINNYYTGAIGHYLAHGGNLIIAGTGLPTGEGLIYRDTPILFALRDLGVEIEPYLIGDINNIGDYPLNVITYPNKESDFIGVYISPILSKNKQFQEILFTSKSAWLIDSTTGLEGDPEGDFPVAVYGEGSFSRSFTGVESDAINRLMVIGNSISFTDYITTIDSNSGYDFITRAVYSMVGYDYLMNVRHKYNWEKNFFKIERSLYRESILNSVTILILYIYPLLIFLLAIFNKIFIFFGVRSKS